MQNKDGLTHQYAVRVDDRGRFVVPAAVREELGLKDGDRFLLRLEADGSLLFINMSEQLRTMQGELMDHAPGRSLSEELIEERRWEAENE